MTDEELRRLAEEWQGEHDSIMTLKGFGALCALLRRVAEDARRQERERIYDEAATVTEADWELLLRRIKGGER